MEEKKASTTRRKARRKVDPFKAGFWRGHWAQALILLTVTVALYIRSLPYEFVLDDVIVVTENNFTKQGFDGIARIFTTESFTGYFGEQKEIVAGARYRPLSIAMFAAVYELAELDTRWYHALNIALYTLLVLLVFRCLHILFVRYKHVGPWSTGVPFAGALLFALHPVHTEAVANIKGCDEILAMLFSMLTLYASMRWIWRKSIPWLIASGLFFFTGLLAKENTITFLAVIPLAGWYFSRKKIQRIAITIIPLIAAFGIYLAVRIGAVGFLFSDTVSNDLLNNPFVQMNGSEKWATIVYTLGVYLKLLVFPHPLTHDYYPYHIPIMHWTDWKVILTLAVYALLAFVAIRGLKTRSVASFCVIFFVATISITANIVFPIGTFMNERFLFMPSLAFCIALPYYITKVKIGQGFIPPIVLGLFAVLFAIKSFTRIPAWESPLSLNTAGVSVSQNSCRANCFMGTAIYNEAIQISDRQERFDRMLIAEQYLDKSLSIYPNYYSANQMKSGIVAEHYRVDRNLDALLNGFEEILRRRPNIPYIPKYCEYLNGRSVDTRKMSDWYFRVSHDIMLVQHKRKDYAKLYVDYALQFNPGDARINYAAGRIYEANGNQQAAQEYYNRAYTLDPSLRN